MESFISTMETNALMGMNVAQLIADDFNRVLEVERAGQKMMWENMVEEL